MMRTGDGLVLVDWDTVALAPPERDLWMLVHDTAGETTIPDHDHDAVEFFRLTWDLKDLAERINLLRSPHQHTDDTAGAYDNLTTLLG